MMGKFEKDTGTGRFFKDFKKYHGLPVQDAIFFNQSDLICDMAKHEDFIVMGRCAFDQSVRRMMEINSLNYKQAEHLLKKLDKRHERYYHAYTGKKWGDAVNYDLCIDSASYGIKESVELIERMINKYPNS